MNSSIRKFALFIVIIALLWFAYAYMVKPANRHIAAQRKDINEKVAKLSELAELSSAAENVDQQLAKLSEAMKFFEDKLPPESEIHKVLENITLIAQKQGLQCGNVTAVKQKDYNGYIEQPLKMALSGSFYSFYSFMLQTEKLDRIIRIRRLDIEVDGKDPSVVDAEMVISVFFRT